MPLARLNERPRYIAAGEIKILTIHGDVLTATKTDGSKITARKESNLSALETLQLLGAPAEVLALQAIDQEIRQILDSAYQRARTIIVAQQPKLEALAGALLEYETIERPQFEALIA